MPILSKEQINFFYQEGYVIVHNIYTKDEIDNLRNFFKEKFNNGFWEISKYNSSTIINDIYHHFPEMVNIIFNSSYIGAVKDILGKKTICIPECCVHHNRFFDWHRDTTIMESTGERLHRAENSLILQCCIYFQDNSSDGGGLTLVPKSQKKDDRFVKIYYGNLIDKLFYKILKILHCSTFHLIEKSENPINIPTKIGDILIFNNQLDHRATFLRSKNGKPKHSNNEKFAIFNAFCNKSNLASAYLNSLKKPNEQYAKFLRQTTTAPALIKRAKELDFSIMY